MGSCWCAFSCSALSSPYHRRPLVSCRWPHLLCHFHETFVTGQAADIIG
ncbi:hypothetical protein SJ05684_c01170 [Sinorhizobium sojae CCBAU 05684]|uniref:Uncharacterized protein n=1 Tax=Sinorhizobium sojae CCBAU 05684 TaxID=716928 RepID=A0A249P6N2_9HYPH|nr:hypothetical protein SJ05684_c01170 [Sinorhizobium sojae CCBAU 05684]